MRGSTTSTRCKKVAGQITRHTESHKFCLSPCDEALGCGKTCCVFLTQRCKEETDLLMEAARSLLYV